MRGVSERMHVMYIHFDLIYDPKRSKWDATIPGGLKELERFKSIIHPKINNSVINNLEGKLEIDNKSKIRLLMERMISNHQERPLTSAFMLSGLMLKLVYEIIEAHKKIGNITT